MWKGVKAVRFCVYKEMVSTITTTAAATAATTASISAINSGLNGGDLGDILGDSLEATVSEDNLKQTAISMAIGGLAGMAGEWIGNVKAEYVAKHPDAGSWMGQGNSNLKMGTMENSKIGVNAQLDTNGIPIRNADGMFIKEYSITPLHPDGIPVSLWKSNQNPIFQTLNTVPGMQSFSHFHDAALVGASDLWTMGSIAPYLPISYASAIAPYYQIYNNYENAKKINDIHQND